MGTRWVVTATCLAFLCGCIDRSAADHETLGDRAYGEHDYATALVEYKLELAQDSSNKSLRAKAGSAALGAGDLLAAARAFGALVEDEEYSALAANGLEMTASRAVEEGNREALHVALRALLAVRETRAVRRFASELATGFGAGTTVEEAVAILPVAAAAASDTRTQDSLVFEYGGALTRAGNCARAADVFEAVVRRERHPRVAVSAAEELARCAVRLGHEELRQGHPQEAERWFQRAVIGEGETQFEAAAYLGLGDVAFARGDYLAAQDAYLSVMDLTSRADSLYDVALRRLNSLGDAGTDPDRKVF